MRSSLLLTLFLLSSIWTVAKPSIVIFPIKNTGKYHSQLTSKDVTNKVVDAFTNNATLEVIDRENLPAILQSIDGDSALDARMLRNVQADYLCFGTYNCSIKKTAKYLSYIRTYMCKIYGRVNVNLRIVSVKTARVVASDSNEGKGLFKKKSPTGSISTPDKLFDYMCKKSIPKTVNALTRKMDIPPTNWRNKRRDNDNHSSGGAARYPSRRNTVTVWATGYGNNYGNARENALNNAFRQAIEKIAGVYVESSSELRDFHVVRDKILTDSRGFISNHSVLQENKVLNPGDVAVKLRVTCTVAWTKIRERWKLVRHKVKRKKYPRLMIMLKTNHKGFPANLNNSFDQDTVQIGLEGIFSEAGFRVQSVAQVEKLHKRKIQLAIQEDNTDLLIALGKQFKAECILRFDFRATLDKSSLYGTAANRYRMITVVQGRIFRVDTGQLLGSLSKSYSFSGLKSTFAIHGGFNNAGKQFAKDMIGAILRQSWDHEAGEGSNVEILISGISYRKVRKLKKSLERDHSVKQLNQRSYNDKVWHGEIMSGLSSDKVLDLVFDLGEKHGLEFEVKENTQNKIVLRVE